MGPTGKASDITHRLPVSASRYFVKYFLFASRASAT